MSSCLIEELQLESNLEFANAMSDANQHSHALHLTELHCMQETWAMHKVVRPVLCLLRMHSALVPGQVHICQTSLLPVHLSLTGGRFGSSHSHQPPMLAQTPAGMNGTPSITWAATHCATMGTKGSAPNMSLCPMLSSSGSSDLSCISPMQTLSTVQTAVP